MSDILRITRKELSAFFGSPVAYLFIGAFLATCLFVFFWVDAFFARNIADTRPLFDWMPVLLIFLASALGGWPWPIEEEDEDFCLWIFNILASEERRQLVLNK
jgi:ABC-2 type transport system permease protein